MSVTLRPFTRAEYHDFYRRYVPDPVMDPRPYRYNWEHVDRCFDYEESRREWYPVFGIFDERGLAVGALSLKRIEPERRRCELGIMMADDSCKNRGYGTEALRQAIRMARETYGLRQMLADTAVDNGRMQHVLTKLGFRLLGRRDYGYERDGRWVPRLDYVLEMEECP